MPQYKVLRDHLTIGGKPVKTGDVVDESVIGKETAAALVKAKRLSPVTKADKTSAQES